MNFHKLKIKCLEGQNKLRNTNKKLIVFFNRIKKALKFYLKSWILSEILNTIIYTKNRMSRSWKA
jgi:hypothetical protein